MDFYDYICPDCQIEYTLTTSVKKCPDCGSDNFKLARFDTRKLPSIEQLALEVRELDQRVKWLEGLVGKIASQSDTSTPDLNS